MTEQPTDRAGIDNGCNYHNDCFTCPFHDCIAGVQGGYQYIMGQKRKAEVKQLVGQGYSDKYIAGQLGVSIRTVARHKAG